MDNKVIAIHVGLLLFTAGVGNVLYFGYNRNWSRKQLVVAGVAALMIVLAFGAMAPSDTTTPSSNITDSPEEELDNTSEEELDNTSEEELDNTSEEELEETNRSDLMYSAIDTLEQEEHIELAYVEISEDETLLEVEWTAVSEDEVAYSLGWISGVYASIVEEDDSAGDANIIVNNYYNGKTTGTVTIEREWAKDYNNGEISEQEYSLRVINSIEANT